MKAKLILAILFAGMLFVAACDSAKKTAADATIKGAQTAYAAVADQAKEYVPDQAKDVQASIQSAKDAFTRATIAQPWKHRRLCPRR